jgi:TolB-like protein/Tfp pilus assembly protein PilF
MQTLWLRLKERKLVQWALAYLAGAWLLLQVIHLLGEQFEWPLALLRSITLVLGVGVFAAIVIAWYHGEKGAQRVSGPELLMLAGLLVVAGGVVWLVSRGSTGAGAEAAHVGLPAPGQPALFPAVPIERALAVLPFDNLSADPENEYFSDGITDEILMMLANIGELRVISRTSAMRYKGSDKSLREIAFELGVAHMLEGSVQRSGDRVRITAQLIDARTDVSLWAERYDRPLEDIFAVQSEIAQRIAQALQARLSAAERTRLDRRPTDNLTAHDYVLRGWDHLRRNTRPDLGLAFSLLRRATELDPTYPDVLVALSEAFQAENWYVGDRRLLDSAVVAARRALTLDPELALGHSRLGLALDHLGEREEALEAHRRAVELSPNLSDGLANLYHYGFGRLDEAARWWHPALATDPTNGYLSWLAGRTYLHLGMPARARALLDRSLEFQPNNSWTHYTRVLTFLLEGRDEDAHAQIHAMFSATGESPHALLFAGHGAAALGDLPVARRYLERGLSGAGDWNTAQGALLLAWILQHSGEAEGAGELLRDATARFERRWGGQPRRLEDYVDLARIRVVERDREEAVRQMQEAAGLGWRFLHEHTGDPILESLRGDPRYDRLMAEVKADVDRMRARVEREGW